MGGFEANSAHFFSTNIPIVLLSSVLPSEDDVVFSCSTLGSTKFYIVLSPIFSKTSL